MANRRSESVVVIVTYHNEGRLLDRALESIDRQTYAGEIDVIVVDDASEVRPVLPDGFRFPVRVIRSDRSIYLSAARNLGWRQSQGEYLCFLDADDVFLPEKIENQVAFLREHRDALAAVGSYYVHHRDGRVWLQVPEVVHACFPDRATGPFVLPDQARHEVCVHYVCQMGAATIRRQGLERIGGFEDSFGRWGEDWDFWVRLTQTGRIGFIPSPASRYLCGTAGITATLNPEKFESGIQMFRRCRRQVEGLPRHHKWTLRDRERRWHLLAAQTYLEGPYRPARAVGHSLQSLMCGPSIRGVRSLARSGLHWLRSVAIRRPPSIGKRRSATVH